MICLAHNEPEPGHRATSSSQIYAGWIATNGPRSVPLLVRLLGLLVFVLAAVALTIGLTSSAPASGNRFQEVGYRLSASSDSQSSHVHVQFRLVNLGNRTATANCKVKVPGFGTAHFKVGPIPPGGDEPAQADFGGSASALTSTRNSGGQSSIAGYTPIASVHCA
jgi:hypothetical protein